MNQPIDQSPEEALAQKTVHYLKLERIRFCLHPNGVNDYFQVEVLRSCGRGMVHIYYGDAYDKNFMESYVKKNLPDYHRLIKQIKIKGSAGKLELRVPLSEKYIDEVKFLREQEEEMEQQRIKAEIEAATRLPDKYEIENLVKQQKGFPFSNKFVCKLCYCTHSNGYSYLIRGHEVAVCTYCRSDLRRTKPYVKVILTNMGNGKRS